MDSEQLVARLQEARDRRELRRLLREHDGVDVGLVTQLRAEADRCERTDPRRALRVAEAALYVSNLLADPLSLASSTWAKANALRALGRYRQCLVLYDQAAAAYHEQGQEVEAARTRIGQIDALMYQSRYDDALAAANAARKVLHSNGEHLQTAKLDANAGNVYHRMDRYEEALRLYDRARRTFVQLEQGAFVAHVDVNRANVFTQLASFRQAEEAYLEARSSFESADARATVAMIDTNLGVLYFSQGRYNRALERLNLARRAFEELDIPKNAAVVDLDLSDVYLALNLPQEAIELSERARSACSRLGMHLEAARATANRAFGHLQLGQHAIAGGLLAEARQVFHREGNDVWAATMDLHRAVLLSQPPASKPDFQEALALCQSASLTFRKAGLAAKRAYAQIVEGNLHENLDQEEEALQLYRNALRSANRLHLPWLIHQAQHALGRLEEASSPAGARRRYLLAIEALEGMWSDLQPEELRTAFLSNRLQVYEDLILLSLESGPVGAREAFEYVERAKSRALVDMLAGRLEARVKSQDNGEMAQRLAILREELNWFYNRLSDGQAPGGQRRQVWVEETASQIQQREVQINQILRQLQLRGEEYASLQRVHTVSLEAVQDLLDADTTLVEYYLAGSEIVAFVVDRHSIWVERGLCSRAQATSLADRLRFHLAKFGYNSDYVDAHFDHLCTAMNEHLRRLYDGLIRPLHRRLRGGKLIVVPHGQLHYLPFHAFFDGRRYLIEDFEVAYSPSASVLQLCSRRPSRPLESMLALGVGDGQAPLVADEVEKVGALFPRSTVLKGEQATLEALRKHGPGCDAIHIACHGVFSPSNPMFSRLKLGDAWANVHDVYNLELQASLISLSACETGLNRIAAGDELIGLARGFFYAGTPSLLLSLWAVNDGSTARLMEGFYRRLLAGQNKAEALRGAQLEIKEEYVHPYHWAPFVLLGRSD